MREANSLVAVPAPEPVPALPARAPKRDAAEPLTAELRRLHVTVSSRLLEKLDAARAALFHSHPGGSAEEILEAGLDLVLERQAKRNYELQEYPVRNALTVTRKYSAGPRFASAKRVTCMYMLTWNSPAPHPLPSGVPTFWKPTYFTREEPDSTIIAPSRLRRVSSQSAS